MEQYNGVLRTPCGNILVVDEDNTYIPFHIEKNKFDCDYEFENAEGKTKVINTDTNYALVIKTSSLKYGTRYQIYMTDTKLEFGDSDERTECVSGCSNGYCIAIGAYSPNDDEKQEQAYAYSKKMGFLKHRFIQDPPTFDESKFTKYDVERLDDNSGFSFHLIDDKCSEIRFYVAWIRSEKSYEVHYEGAVQFWTT